MFSGISLLIVRRCNEKSEVYNAEKANKLFFGMVALDVITAIALITLGSLALSRGLFSLPLGGGIAMVTVGVAILPLALTIFGVVVQGLR